MKKHVIFPWLLIGAAWLCSCHNELEQELDELRQELNAQRELIDQLRQGNTVSGIAYTDEGYTLTLSDGSTIALTYATPIISRSDNGHWLLNGQETGIPADEAATSPTLTTGDNSHWFINGQDTGIQAQTSTNELVNIVLLNQNLIFTFSDGTQISVAMDGTENLKNDICLPKYLYMLSDTRNDVFVEPFIRRWRPSSDIVRFNSQSPMIEQTTRHICLAQPIPWQTLGVNLYNEELEVVKSHTSIIRVGEKGTGNGEVRVQIVGDSYVHGGFFKDALLAQGYVPGIRMIGLREVEGYEGQYDEGRSGDRLADYFGVHTGETKAYQGFMHPEGDHRYYGATGFWINCHKVMNGNTGLAVTCGRYDDCAVRFDPQTGYLLNPRTGDVQYDNGKGSFVLWDGTQWTPVQQNDFTWSFDYGKYLEAWDLPAPQFMGEMLGLNDFRGDMNADFTEWNERIETMKRSYLEAVPDGKFMILIPCSTCGSMNNDSGAFTLQQNAAMWRLRKNIIDTFDNREDEGFYLVDVALAIDNEDGYRKDENGVQTGNPHPYLSYPAMGVPIAAFIQYHR